ncbi:MAG: hypothetical protein ACKO96_44915, partial [Flammeovirgaceae bacterium]
KKINNKEFEEDKRNRLIEWVVKYKFRLKKEADYFYTLKKDKKTDEFYNLSENFLMKFDLTTHPFSEYIFKDIYSSIYEKFRTENIFDFKDFLKLRVGQMNSLNPKFILRNHLAQKVINEAENSNFKEL